MCVGASEPPPDFTAHPQSTSQRRCGAEHHAGGAWRAGPSPRAAARPSAWLRGSPPRGTRQHQPMPPGVVTHTAAGVKTRPQGRCRPSRQESIKQWAHQGHPRPSELNHSKRAPPPAWGHPRPSELNHSKRAPPPAPDPQRRTAFTTRQAGSAHLPTAGRSERRARLQPNPGSTHAHRARYTDTEPHTPLREEP